MAFLTIDGKRIHYDRKGSGNSTVIFLHGYAENSRIWRYVNEDTPFDSIAIDFPGFGESEFQENISVPGLAVYVHKILQELQVENPILIGHSLGGYVAIAYAKAFPDNAAAIALLNSHPFADNAARVKMRNKSIQFIKKNGVSKYIPLLYNNLFYRKEGYIQKTIRYLIDMHEDIPDEVWIAYIRAMRDRPDNIHVLEQWHKPILFLLGKHDDLIPWEKQLSQVAYAPVSELVILENTGHMSHFEDRIKTREALIDFVQFVEEMR